MTCDARAKAIDDALDALATDNVRALARALVAMRQFDGEDIVDIEAAITQEEERLKKMDHRLGIKRFEE